MSRVTIGKLKKAGSEKNQSKLVDHLFGKESKDEEPKRKRKRSKKNKEQVQSPEQPHKKQLLEMDPTSANVELTEDQLKLQIAITQAIRQTNKQDLNDMLSPISRDVSTLLELKDTIERQTRELHNIKLENQDLKQRCHKMEMDHDQLKERISKLENIKIENNVIFHGIEEPQWESDEDLINKIYEYMAETVKGEGTPDEKLKKVKKFKIEEASRLGPKTEHKWTRPVRVRYEHPNTVNILLANKKMLPAGIFVDKEYSTETTKNRRILRPYFNAARKSTEFFKKCRMEEDVLILNGTRYTVCNLHELPEQLNGFHVNSRSDPQTYAYFGENNPFSNFHACEFTINGRTYINTEQYIQSEKAKHFKDSTTIQQILSAKSGLDCKRLSKNIKNYRHDEWIRVAKGLSEPGIIAKFNQNPQLIELLMKTDDKLIVESSRDPVWGTGVPIHDLDVLSRDKWKGNGIMSDILMNIRDNLRSECPAASSTEPMDDGTRP